MAKNFDPRMVIGTTGLQQYGGTIDEEFLPLLRGINGVRLYQEMGANSPVLAAAMHVIKMLIRRVSWRIEEADDSNLAMQQKEFIEGAFEDTSHTMEDLISEVLSYLQYGWSFFETVYKIRRGDSKNPEHASNFNDGLWGWRKFEIRAQSTLDSWVFAEDGGIEAMVQQDYNAGRGPVVLPMEKCLLFRTETTKGNPEGLSLFRPAVIPYWNCKRVSEYEVIGVERDLAGMPIFEVPFELLMTDAPAELKALRAQLEQFVTQVRRDQRWGGLVPSEQDEEGKPSGYKFKLMGTSGKRQIETDAIIRRYESRMLMLFLAQFLILGQDKVGSFSLASSMTDLFSVAIGTFMDIISAVFNRFAIPRLQKMNGRPMDLNPTLVHGDIESPNLKEIGEYIGALANAGMTSIGHRKIERKLLEFANLPQPDDDEMDELEGMMPEEGTEGAVPMAGAPGALSSEQVKTVLEINRSMHAGDLDRPAALQLLAAALGVATGQAEKYLSEEPEEPEEPPVMPPGAPPVAPPPPNPNGGGNAPPAEA
jgi:hypothetical protein